MLNYKQRIRLILLIVTLFIIHLISQHEIWSGKSNLNILHSEIQNEESSSKPSFDTTSKTSSEKLQLNLPHCKIPKVHIYSHHYRPKYIKFDSCENELIFSTLKKGIIQLQGFGLHSKCCVSEIVRPYKLPSDGFETRECIPFKNFTITMDFTGKEFIKVVCTESKKFKKSKKLIINNNFYANIIPSAHYLKEKIKYWKGKMETPVNVLVLVLDSTSRTEAFRHLPITMNYLLNELNFIDFKGFHHLGEPTLVNAIPLLLGIPISEFFGNIKKAWKETWDNLPFIWKVFNNYNFATAYIEDLSLGTFNYGGQTGFTYKPTDFYLRPFTLANEINKRVCVGKTVIEKFILDYQLEMLKKMNGIVPVFSIPWLSWPQHDYFGTLDKLENPILNFFESIKNTPSLLENTVMIVTADHGFYVGKYAQSHEGLLERRLPLFLIRLPSKLISIHPEFADRVIKNSNRITSHYDVYKTLLHLAQLSAPGITTKKFEQKFGKSLLKFIPQNRTCLQAGIPKNNCACNLPFPSTKWFNKVPSIMALKGSGIKNLFKVKKQ